MSKMFYLNRLYIHTQMHICRAGFYNAREQIGGEHMKKAIVITAACIGVVAACSCWIKTRKGG